MPSYDVGKNEVVNWVRRNFPADARVLDVGACDGKWKNLLPEYTMDAVEVWKPYCKQLKPLYEEVFNMNIIDFRYRFYDLIIFGDVIEHMTVEEAREVLNYAYWRCKDMVIAVPFLYPQGEWQGNPYQAHKQPELTAELFAERYKGFDVLFDTGNNYCYYHKKATV